MGRLRHEDLIRFSTGEIFIETGSMYGAALQVAKHFGFKKLHGIELNKKFYDFCVDIFKNDECVTMHFGESPDILLDLIKNINSPVTFWLDAHVSGPDIPGGKYGPTPILHELQAIAQSGCSGHVLYIDDVRLLGTDEWNFVTKDQVLEQIFKINPNYNITYLNGNDDGSLPNDILVATI